MVFKTFKISVNDFLSKKDKKIILEENITVLTDIIVNSNEDYVKNALKNLKKTSVSDPHQLKILYRRWSVEDNICRYYIEHFINAIDRGPSSYISDFNITQSRRSSEYRFIKNEQKLHSLKYMEYNNPLRKGISVKSYDWKKQGVSSYDGEDVIILEGISKKSNTTDKPNTIKIIYRL